MTSQRDDQLAWAHTVVLDHRSSFVDIEMDLGQYKTASKGSYFLNKLVNGWQGAGKEGCKAGHICLEMDLKDFTSLEQEI